MWKTLVSFLLLVVQACIAEEEANSNGVCDCSYFEFVDEYSCTCENVTISQSESFNPVINHEQYWSNEYVTHLIIQNSIEFNQPEILETFPNVRRLEFVAIQLENLIPLQNCSRLTDFYSWDNNINELRNGTFQACRNLSRLWVGQSEVSAIEDEAFEGLEVLDMLVVYGNKISSINRHMFTAIKQLTYLDISNNRIESIPADTFADLTKLQFLNLIDNHLKIIDGSLFKGLISLETLSLINNLITDIHRDAFKDLAALKHLNLHGNYLTQLGGFLKNLKNLKLLDLGKNQINAIDPQAFRYLTSLRDIHLDENICVDKQFLNINDLETEVMPKLDGCFDNYGKETSENTVRCNYFMDAKLGYTCQLSGISFNENSSSFLIVGDHLSGMTDFDVWSVRFVDSSLSRIPKQVTQKFQSLTQLIARNVSIHVIDEKTLENCGNVKVIDFSENGITSISDEAFEDCKILTSVNLSINRISSLSARVFHRNLKLESINMDGNLIRKVEPCNNAIRFDLKNLKSLSLKWNICINNAFRDQYLNIRFNRIGLRDMNVCFGFWYF